MESYSYCGADVSERNCHESVLDKTVFRPCDMEKYILYALFYWSVCVNPESGATL